MYMYMYMYISLSIYIYMPVGSFAAANLAFLGKDKFDMFNISAI